MARQSLSGEPVLTDAQPEVSIFHGTDADRSTLTQFAKQDPAAFREYIARVVEQLKAGFQISGQKGGSNRSIHEGLEAGLDWRLVINVLDVIWPAEKGRLHARKMEALWTIIIRTKAYAVGESEDESDHANDVGINKDMVSGILTLRYQINSLNQVIHFVERRLHSFQGDLGMDDYIWRREQRLENWGYFPLIIWRRELERRLDFGDYRAWKKGLRRATGDSIQVPDMPRLRNKMSLSQRTLRLVRAAKPLRTAP
jgi:hypothetical protein